MITTSRYSPGTTSECGRRRSAVEQCGDVRFGAHWRGGRQRGERLVRRAVVIAEDLDPVRRRAVAEIEVLRAARMSGACCRRARRGAARCPTAPATSARPAAAHSAPMTLNSWPMKPSGRPVREPDAAAGAHDAQHFARRPRVIRREHRAEGRERDVEATVVERQRPPRRPSRNSTSQAFGQRARAAPFRAAPARSRSKSLGEPARGGERGVAVAGGDVEHAFAGAHVGRFGERFADDLQRHADDGEVAAGPRACWLLFDGGEVRRGRFSGSCCRLIVKMVMIVLRKGCCGLVRCILRRERALTLYRVSFRFARAS